MKELLEEVIEIYYNNKEICEEVINENIIENRLL